MTAVGFGAGVTGGGDNPTKFFVTSGDNNGVGTLARALKDAKTAGGKTKIVINANVVITRRASSHTIDFGDLTISGMAGSRIRSNLFLFDCDKSDNVILKNLTFEGTPDNTQAPRDAILLDAREGRGRKGFWISHCEFNAYYDLNITANAGDLAADKPPLLITISKCLFQNDLPGGVNRENNGALGIHGDKKTQNTNAYATVTRNVFRTVRRRSPRSSGKCVVHAFNNVLLQWGTPTGTGTQANGMESGNDGRLVAQANYFQAGALKETISLATDDARRLGHLTIDDTDLPANTLKNIYVDTTDKTAAVGAQIDIQQLYRDRSVQVEVKPMDDTLRALIEAQAGPKPEPA